VDSQWRGFTVALWRACDLSDVASFCPRDLESVPAPSPRSLTFHFVALSPIVIDHLLSSITQLAKTKLRRLSDGLLRRSRDHRKADMDAARMLMARWTGVFIRFTHGPRFLTSSLHPGPILPARPRTAPPWLQLHSYAATPSEPPSLPCSSHLVHVHARYLHAQDVDGGNDMDTTNLASETEVGEEEEEHGHVEQSPIPFPATSCLLPQLKAGRHVLGVQCLTM
jgi:hypothetical protein